MYLVYLQTIAFHLVCLATLSLLPNIASYSVAMIQLGSKWVQSGFRTRTGTWLESLSGSEPEEPELKPAMKPKWVLNLNPNPLAIPYQVSNPGQQSSPITPLSPFCKSTCTPHRTTQRTLQLSRTGYHIRSPINTILLYVNSNVSLGICKRHTCITTMIIA